MKDFQGKLQPATGSGPVGAGGWRLPKSVLSKEAWLQLTRFRSERSMWQVRKLTNAGHPVSKALPSQSVSSVSKLRRQEHGVTGQQ